MKADRDTNVDGIFYPKGSEVPDLGNWVALEMKGRYREYEGLSEDVDKLPKYVASGSSALCLDTGDYYKFHEPTQTWYKL